ncbi:MAG TPA: sigma-54 dependent transcriptional regulator [Devosiaceae bacterium]
MGTQDGSDTSIRAMIVEADARSREGLSADLLALLPAQCRIDALDSGRAAIDLLKSGRFELVLADLSSLCDISHAQEDAMGRLARLADGALIIAMADGGSVSAALAAMRAGAHDCISKPVAASSLAARIEELAQRHGKARALQSDAAQAGAMADFVGFIGMSSQMQYVYEQVERIAPSAAPVFITGERGTGKQVCAEALHQRGPRNDQPFVVVDCASMKPESLECELFGASRGALPGMDEDRSGAMERASGGTLFLDEIGAMDISAQGKLLRFLQTGMASRVGETTARTLDVRVVCATSRNPMQMIADRQFREDLFYRLHVLPIHLPPLRQRPADIMPLARHFLVRSATERNKAFRDFTAEAADLLVARDWPGNVRQLQNLVKKIASMFDGALVEPQMIGAAEIEARASGTWDTASCAAESALREILPLWRQEQRIIEEAVAAFGGNIARAAAALEISPSTIYRKRQIWEQVGDADTDGMAAA